MTRPHFCDVLLAESLRGRLSKLDLLGPEGTFEFTMRCPEAVGGGLIWSVRASAYHFELSIEAGMLQLRRSDRAIALAITRDNVGGRDFTAVIEWSPTHLQLRVWGAGGMRKERTETAHSYPPQELIDWARDEQIAPVRTYESAVDIYGTVVDALEKLGSEIADLDSKAMFWDETREGRRIKAREPKREVEIHPTIRLQLHQALVLHKSLDVTPEYPIGAGIVDFLISGRTVSGVSAKVCVEVKLAHARGLAHGLTVQLPAYMARCRTEYGVYLVIDFGGDWPADTKGFKLPGIEDVTALGLDFVLGLATAHTGRKYLRSVLWNVAKGEAPSKA